MNSRAPRLGTAARLLLTGWVVYTLHFATDIAREHYPAFSLAERGTLRVDPYLGLHPDLFAIPDRGAFINNNPGASLLGARPSAGARPLGDARGARASAVRSDGPPPEFADPRPDRREFFARTYARGLDIRFGLAAGVMQAFGTAPLSAAMLLVMYSVLRRFGFSGRESMWLALVYGFATPIFFRAAFLNHNLFVAHATLGGFALLQRADGITHDPRRLAAAGAVSGAGLLCDYAGAVPLVALGSYALARLFKTLPAGQAVSRFGAMVAGACLPVGALLVYQAWAFGHPLLPAQHYMPATQYSGLGWNGFDWPALDLLAQNLLDPRFGMLAFGPLLALAFAQPLLGSGRRSRDARAVLRAARVHERKPVRTAAVEHRLPHAGTRRTAALRPVRRRAHAAATPGRDRPGGPCNGACVVSGDGPRRRDRIDRNRADERTAAALAHLGLASR